MITLSASDSLPSRYGTSPGPIPFPLNVSEDTSVVFHVTIIQDAQGMVTGSGDTAVEIDGAPSTGYYSVKGKVTNSGGVAKINATVKLSGSGTVQGLDTTYSLSASYKLEIDPITGTVFGSARGSAKAAGVGSGPINDDIEAPLPLGHGWKLDTANGPRYPPEISWAGHPR